MPQPDDPRADRGARRGGRGAAGGAEGVESLNVPSRTQPPASSPRSASRTRRPAVTEATSPAAAPVLDLDAVLRARLAAPLPGTASGPPALVAIVDALLTRAASGDVRAAELLLARTFGAVRQDVRAEVNAAVRVVPPIAWIDAAPVETTAETPTETPAPGGKVLAAGTW